MANPLNDFQFDYLKVVLDVTVYWVGSVFDHSEAILDFYKKSLLEIGNDITFYETETMGGAKPVENDTLDLVPFWLQGTKTKRSIYSLFLESGSAPNLPSQKAFTLRAWEFKEQPVGAVRLILPVSFIQESTEPFIGLVKSLTNELEFLSGHCGYAVNWNETGDFANDAQKKIFLLSQRYLGIDLSSLTTTLCAISNGIKCANWLTLINNDYCERLGGLSELQQSLDQSIVLHPLKHGLMFQAGPRPETGDVNRFQNVPAYHELGRILAPIRTQSHGGFIVHGEDYYDEDATKKWLGRFDQ